MKFTQGKGVSQRGQAYTVWTSPGPFVQKLKWFVRNVTNSHKITVEKQIRRMLHHANPRAEWRSVRRGALTALAHSGLDIHSMMCFFKSPQAGDSASIFELGMARKVSRQIRGSVSCPVVSRKQFEGRYEIRRRKFIQHHGTAAIWPEFVNWCGSRRRQKCAESSREKRARFHHQPSCVG